MSFPFFARGINKAYYIYNQSKLKEFIRRYVEKGFTYKVRKNRIIFSKNGCGIVFNLKKI